MNNRKFKNLKTKKLKLELQTAKQMQIEEKLGKLKARNRELCAGLDDAVFYMHQNQRQGQECGVLALRAKIFCNMINQNCLEILTLQSAFGNNFAQDEIYYKRMIQNVEKISAECALILDSGIKIITKTKSPEVEM